MCAEHGYKTVGNQSFFHAVLRVRQFVIDAILQNLKRAVSAGVGLFLAIIALEESNVIVAHPATLVTLGYLTKPVPVLILLGSFCRCGYRCLAA